MASHRRDMSKAIDNFSKSVSNGLISNLMNEISDNYCLKKYCFNCMSIQDSFELLVEILLGIIGETTKRTSACKKVDIKTVNNYCNAKLKQTFYFQKKKESPPRKERLKRCSSRKKNLSGRQEKTERKLKKKRRRNLRSAKTHSQKLESDNESNQGSDEAQEFTSMQNASTALEN